MSNKIISNTIAPIKGLQIEILNAAGTIDNFVTYSDLSGSIFNLSSSFTSSYIQNTSIAVQNISSSFTFSGTINFASDSGIVGTILANNAATGIVGEYIESNVAVGAAGPSWAANVAQNITSMSLSSGDWNVFGTVICTTISNVNNATYKAAISLVSASVGTMGNQGRAIFNTFGAFASGSEFNIQCPSRRLLLSGTTTIYLTTATVSTVNNGLNCGGYIFARRLY